MIKTDFYPPLVAYVSQLIREADLIPGERRSLLSQLADYIRTRQEQDQPTALTFICTHNSRRSHISQIWAATAAAWYELDGVLTFSGGTEATAFNHRAVSAMKRAGFQVENPGGENPHYRISFSDAAPPLECFSKRYDAPINPSAGFAAIMTCSDADDNCPLIPGATVRLPLTYEDPKAADDTPAESRRYDERVRQIGRELFFAIGQVSR